MIITVTLNPAIDKTVEIEHFTLNGVNRISSSRSDVGGKGINVSKVVRSLGGRSKAVGMLAGTTGDRIKKYLDGVGIENDFVFVEGETRTNIKIVDPLQHTNTDVNEVGPAMSSMSLEELNRKILGSLNPQSVLVLSGSVPANVGQDIYRIWIAWAKEKGAKTILDADGEYLKAGLEAGPYLIKPNIHELERIFGIRIHSNEEAAKLARGIIKQHGVEVVVISLGGEGALFLNKDCTILAHGMKVDVKSTVGAGDAMVAALAYSIDCGYSFERAVRLAVAAGTANVMTSGTEPSTLETIMELEKQVLWEYLRNDKETKGV